MSELFDREPISVIASHEEWFTGCWTPQKKVATLPRFSATGLGTYSREELIKIASHPTRVPARVEFPANEYIRNQGRRGSCNGYSNAKGVEKAVKRRGRPHVPLSGEWVYLNINGGQDQGSALSSGQKFISQIGVCPESMVPHEAYLKSQVPRLGAAQEAARNSIAFACYGLDSEMEMLTALAIGWIVVAAIHCGGNWGTLDSNGVQAPAGGRGNHSIHLDDLRYRNGRFEMDMANSHGTRYGQEGRAWTTFDGHYAQTIEYHDFFAIVTSNDGADKIPN